MAPVNDNNKPSRNKIKQSLEQNRERWGLTDECFNRLENMIYNVIHNGDDIHNHNVEYKRGKNILRLTWDVQENNLMIYYQNYYILSFDKTCKELSSLVRWDVTFITTPNDSIYYFSEYRNATHGKNTRNKLINDENYTRGFVINNDKVCFGRMGPPSKYEKISDDSYEWSHQFYETYEIYKNETFDHAITYICDRYYNAFNDEN